MKTTSATLLGMMLLSPLVAALPQGNIDHSLIPPMPFPAELETCSKAGKIIFAIEGLCVSDKPKGAPQTIADCRKELCDYVATIQKDMSSEKCLSEVASVSDWKESMSDWKESVSDWKDPIGRRSADMSTIGSQCRGDKEPTSVQHVNLRPTIGPRSADIPSDQIAQYEAAKERFREQMDNMSKRSPSSSYASPPDGPPPVGGWGSIDWNSIDWNSIDYPSIAGRAEETEDS